MIPPIVARMHTLTQMDRGKNNTLLSATTMVKKQERHYKPRNVISLKGTFWGRVNVLEAGLVQASLVFNPLHEPSNLKSEITKED